jgi:hypothetical protein
MGTWQQDKFSTSTSLFFFFTYFFSTFFFCLYFIVVWISIFQNVTVSPLFNIFKRVEVQFKLLKPTGYVMHHQFNIQQLYALSTLYLCVLYLSENKQRLVPLTAWTDWFL